MKKIIIFCYFLMLFSLKVQSQSQVVVFNEKLLTQITKNHSVREASNQVFYNIFKEQTDDYKKINEKMVQVMTIHEHIYSQLNNINSLFRQGKQIKYIKQYFIEILKNGKEMVKLCIKYPEHSIWLTDYHQNLYLKTLSLKSEIDNIFLKTDTKRLMDANDRDTLIDTIYMKLRQINAMILTITNLVEFQKSRSYIYSIPKLGNWIEHDKLLIQDIIHRTKYLSY